MPYDRPTLVLGRDQQYQMAAELEELKHALERKTGVPMPSLCFRYLDLSIDLTRGEIAQDAYDAELQQLPAERLQETIAHCADQGWLLISDEAILITPEGVKARDKQAAYDRLAQADGGWRGLVADERRARVLQAAASARGVAQAARMVAQQFQPPANEETIRNWINRRPDIREAILRRSSAKKK